jgi:hypothetical protein
MVQIDISLLPKSGTPTGTINPNPFPDSSAHTNDEVLWVFHVFDSNIKSVEIEWRPGTKSYLFPHKGNGNAATRVRTDVVGGTATIWGRAPDLNNPPPNPPRTERCKYNINAYDVPASVTGVQPAYSMDPDVITEQP